ncbi:helicase-exonuclease AddAB subunit AddB [Priestia endophytica]|uniref:helicase-exonuclease AddAB subunit AddB n=1 Tax=Priestia endophytica TaxID=135735 RepID=UPI00124D0FC4|nr:helicase-exonuclease AddAB subunit AddB [Priestia endophytica]KAB2496513.1 helicase-exonuclease AddAB subunit AddB [Priestia endophytica]
MALQFIIGRSGSGKTSYCLDQIRSELRSDPLGDPIIYLVPEQMTFQSDYNLVSTKGLAGMIRAQVLSFTRLSWKVLQEVGGMTRLHLDDTGIHMLLRRIIEEKRDELSIFKNAAEKQGFVDKLESMIIELKRYCLEPEALTELVEETKSEEGALGEKLQDLLVIYKSFEEYLFTKYVDSEDYLQLLAEKLPYSSYVKNATVYVDGFYTFTPQELNILFSLMKEAKDVKICLTGEKESSYLFRTTAETYQTLKNGAGEESIEIIDPLVLKGGARYNNSSSLRHLEQFFEHRPVPTFEQEVDDIKLFPSANRRAEIEGVAREVRKIVSQGTYRYRDIAVIVRNPNEYEDTIRALFQDYDIPHFMDQKRAMAHHPLIELLRSSLEIAGGSWRYEPIFRAIKTDLLFPIHVSLNEIREEMDKLENYVLSYGIQGSRWTSEEKWTYRRYRSLEDVKTGQTDEEREIEQKLNELREIVVHPIYSLQKSLKKAKTGFEYGKAIYEFLLSLNIPEKMEKLREEAKENGDLQRADEHHQVWKAVIHLLDQFVEMMGEQKLSFTLFSSILDTGFDSLKFALVPQAIDQVMVANFERSRLTNIKAVFVIGANDGVIPALPVEDSLLSDSERENLQRMGASLAPSTRDQLFDEDFLIYLAFVLPKERLYITYPLANEEGKTLLPSRVINHLREMFPLLKEEWLAANPAELPEEAQLAYIQSPYTSLANLAYQLQAWRNGYPISPIWWDVYNYFIKDENYRLYSRQVLSSLFYKNEAKMLSQGITKKLYGQKIKTSVSRMEKFNACPYSHFAAHGLKLKERRVFKLNAPDIGELFHGALKLISERLQHEGKEWSELTRQECHELAAFSVDELSLNLQNEILLSSHRHRYLKRKLQQTVERATIILSDHAKASGFAPIGLELAFGPKETLPSLPITLPNGTKMELVGRIDRIDKAMSSKGLLLRIIDYKSSDRDIDLVEVYYGLSLQMLAYLDVVITYATKWLGKEALPAGVLYFHVHNPYVNSTKLLKEDEIENELFKKFKMKGLLLGEEESIKLMDTTLESGHSKIVSAGLKKTGGFYSNSSVASEQEFETIRNYIRQQFEASGTSITEGKIDISPYKLKDRTPCEFCSYKSVCQFDQAFEENSYRELKKEQDKIVLERMKEEGETK